MWCRQIAPTRTIDESKEFWPDDVPMNSPNQQIKSRQNVKNRGVRQAAVCLFIGRDMPSIPHGRLLSLSNAADEHSSKAPSSAALRRRNFVYRRPFQLISESATA